MNVKKINKNQTISDMVLNHSPFVSLRFSLLLFCLRSPVNSSKLTTDLSVTLLVMRSRKCVQKRNPILKIKLDVFNVVYGYIESLRGLRCH